MGRRKVEIKLIEDKHCRQVAFCKRRKGVLKKAKELSILCDVDAAVVIISNRGRLHEFSSNNSLAGILQRYESHVEAEKELSAEIQAAEHSKYSRFMTTGELLQATERQLEETNADDLTVTDLIHMENELQTALIHTRSRKYFNLVPLESVPQNEANLNNFVLQTHLLLESVKDLHEKGFDSLNFDSQIKEKLLGEEKKHLEDNMASIKKVNEMSMDFTDLSPPHIICGQQRATLKFL